MKNLSLLYFLLTIISLNVHSQKKYDIGIISGITNFTGGAYYESGTNLRNLNNFNLEFRNQLNDNWRLNFGISYGFYAPQQSGGNNSTLYSITDTSITYRVSGHRQSMIAMRFGVERAFNKQLLKNPIFKTRVFSYGFNILLGRTIYVLNKYNRTSCYDSLYLPIPYYSNNYNYSISSNSDRYTSSLLNGALQFSLKANLPINERLTFSITSLSSLDFILNLLCYE